MNELFLADVVIERIGAKDGALRAPDKPFLAVGEIARLTDRIVSDHVHHQVLNTLINQLMRLVRTEDKGVTRSDRCLPIFMARNALTGDDVKNSHCALWVW